MFLTCFRWGIWSFSVKFQATRTTVTEIMTWNNKVQVEWQPYFFSTSYSCLNLVQNILTHWEELLQSVSDSIFSKHCGCTPRGVRGVKRPEILWGVKKYSLPGWPSSQNWVKLKTKKMNQNRFWIMILFSQIWYFSIMIF